MIIDLIRHTKPDIKPGIFYGQTDLALANSFEVERAALQQKIQSHYDLLITSPLQRCKQLAQHLNAERIIEEPRIMELNFGRWELQSWDGPEKEAIGRWMDNFVEEQAPEGESMRIMHQRVMDFWQEIKSTEAQSIAVVTHSGVQRLIHAEILQTPLSHLFRLELDYGSIIRIHHDKEHDLSRIRHL